jgi:hypothetical protein
MIPWGAQVGYLRGQLFHVLPGRPPIRNPVPPIREDEATLKQRLQHEHDGHKKPRVQKLYLLASGQAQTRQDVAHLLPCQPQGTLFQGSLA